MPKIIPGVTLRDPLPGDVKRITFVFSKDELDADVIDGTVVYQLVDDGDVVFDSHTGFNKQLTGGALFNDLIALRDGKVIAAIKSEEGFS
jgi:hypothetical protein